jgi:predicted transcriptional regulator
MVKCIFNYNYLLRCGILVRNNLKHGQTLARKYFYTRLWKLKHMLLTESYQYMIICVLLHFRKPMSLKEITNNCQLTYHQVASSIVALRNKGYVKRVQTGFYEVTEEAKLIELSPDDQIKILKNKISELENHIRSLLLRIAKGI